VRADLEEKPRLAEKRYRLTSILLAAAAVAALASTLVWDYVSRDFWEVVPAVPCAVVTGLLAAGAAYASRGRFAFAVLFGLVVGLATFGMELFVAIARWES
jgi:hypothetical protein